MFETISIQDPQNLASDYFFLWAWLLRQPTCCHRGYLRGCRAFPITLPHTGTLNLFDTKFQALKVMDKPLPPLTCAPRPQWVLAGSLRLIVSRAYQHRLPYHNWNVARTLKRSVQKALVVDNHHREDVVAEEIWACLKYPQGTPSYLQGDYSVLKRWHQQESGRQTHPSRNDLEKVSGDYASLYQ